MWKKLIVIAAFLMPAIFSLAKEQPNAHWQTYADCAAAYRVNSQIADPSRAPSMIAMIAVQAGDYQKAAIQRYSAEKKVTAKAADDAVGPYITTAAARFTHEARDMLDKFIEACPQLAN